MATPDDTSRRPLRDVLPRGREETVGLVLRLAGYAVIWWILTGGEGGWLWGLPAVFAAALFNPFPSPASWHWRLRGVLAFVPVFVWLSLCSAADVAARAVHPRRPLTPVLVVFLWRLPTRRGRVFFANLVNLMPGTLCVGFTRKGMTLHILGEPGLTLARLGRLERVVAKLFVPHGESHG